MAREHQTSRGIRDLPAGRERRRRVTRTSLPIGLMDCSSVGSTSRSAGGLPAEWLRRQNSVLEFLQRRLLL